MNGATMDLDDVIRAADPLPDGSLDDWGRRPEGRALLTEIRARAAAVGPTAGGRRAAQRPAGWRRAGLAAVAAVVVLGAAATQAVPYVLMGPVLAPRGALRSDGPRQDAGPILLAAAQTLRAAPLEAPIVDGLPSYDLPGNLPQAGVTFGLSPALPPEPSDEPASGTGDYTSPAFVASLPDDPARLCEVLLAAAREHFRPEPVPEGVETDGPIEDVYPGVEGDTVYLYFALGEVMETQFASPSVQAALFEVTAGLPWSEHWQRGRVPEGTAIRSPPTWRWVGPTRTVSGPGRRRPQPRADGDLPPAPSALGPAASAAGPPLRRVPQASPMTRPSMVCCCSTGTSSSTRR